MGSPGCCLDTQGEGIVNLGDPGHLSFTRIVAIPSFPFTKIPRRALCQLLH